MTRARMIELLEIEHECMLRKSHDDCDGKCEKCELCQSDKELHEMYTKVIWLLKHDMTEVIQNGENNRHIVNHGVITLNM